ncbi:hypothetical protein CAOG_00252 [Capsaspora owczarzaki ATCC 30864]|uniref:General transcription and DNA repair factor IIH subunit TFB5 n=1 Tax=Capsaspora owczarzaki (strain ATCC 30864) TaxID=595528 RepID=A0A0D2U0B7_CAPO3|nr:hypothetical protein CAOG_00252 [Capsaspora owczarzaki ATCC 30864]KJE88626.1 hypothetical protein CAOG_000252 [Capsaspora owczarzaki ATCC 30864]|eukprot:XP_004365123.1 hypothetical protein CAOG_00252 [Capsaspora owczarzaki ATCC 30864]
MHVHKGVLIECDAAIKQFLLHLDSQQPSETRFIIADVDETHLFVDPPSLPMLQTKLDEMLDKNNFTPKLENTPAASAAKSS